jgi:salicylate hydroxylase
MPPLKVGVVGAGIAGLAGVGLRRAGHRVTLFEASTFKREVGAAITITPNGTRVLDAWGFDHDEAGAVEAKQARMVNHETLVPVMQVDIERTRERFGSVVNFYHRVDLHSGLRDLLIDEKLDAPPAAFNLGQRVANLDIASGTVILEDNHRFEMDLLVIANGFRTPFAELITGQPEPASQNRPSGPFAQCTGRSSTLTRSNSGRSCIGKTNWQGSGRP